MCAGSAIWWVLTRLSQVRIIRFINRWAPFVACRLSLNPSVYGAALRGGCCVSHPAWRMLVVLDCAVCLQSNRRIKEEEKKARYHHHHHNHHHQRLTRLSWVSAWTCSKQTFIWWKHLTAEDDNIFITVVMETEFLWCCHTPQLTPPPPSSSSSLQKTYNYKIL